MRRAKGTIHVYTFKEGLMSAVAHDLRIRLEKFDITLEGETVRAELDLTSLRVEGPVENGVLQADKYDAGKRGEVEKAMHGDVLRTDKHPKGVFSGTAAPRDSGFAVQGELELGGKKAALAFDVVEQGGTYRSEFELKPSRWGIAQYKALLGAIRLKDVVRIELALTDA